MVQKILELGEAPKITIANIAGDLHVKGWKRREALVKTICEDRVTFEQSDEELKIDCPEDCIVYVPYDAILHVEQVVGCARFRALRGSLEIGQIKGPLTLREVGPVEVGTIGGELSAKRVRGDLKIEAVSGDANIRDIDGQFHADTVGGDIRLGDVSGGVSATAGGDVKMSLAPVPWQGYSVSAGGNLHCQLPADGNANLMLSSNARSIRINFPDHTEVIRESSYTFVLGEGGAPINLSAGGIITLAGFDIDEDASEVFEFDFAPGKDISNMAAAMVHQATQHVKTHLKSLDTQLSGLSKTLEEAGISEERAREIRQRLEQARERASQRAQEAADRVQIKLEHSLAAAQRKAARQARQHARTKPIHIDVDALRAAKQSSSDPITNEERMMILQMLQENKISLEQAEELLDALEGKSSL